MTSKNLFFKFTANALKRNISNFAIVMLMFFVSVVLVPAMGIKQIQKDVLENYMAHEMAVKTYASYSNLQIISVIVILSAFICAFFAFSFMYSKSKADLYFSAPIKRNTLFMSVYINGIIIFIVSYGLNAIAYILIGMVNGLVTGATVKATIFMFINSSAYFFLIYNIIILAMLLTGNYITAGMASMVLNFYGIYILFAYMSLCENYFETFAGEISILADMSPISKYIASVYKIKKAPLSVSDILIILGIALFILCLDMKVFEKRPAESCNRSISFDIIKAPVRILITFPAAVLGGVYFSAATQKSMAWTIFGIIFVGVLIHGIIETIYDIDIKSFFKSKIQMAVTIIAALFIIISAKNDLLGYDSYVPDKNSIKEIYMDLSCGINKDIDHYDEYGRYTGDYAIDNMSIEDLDSAYEIAKYCANNHMQAEGQKLGTVRVRYHKKNGRDIYRYYYGVSYEAFKEQVIKIYDKKSYREKFYPIFTTDLSKIDNVRAYNRGEEMLVLEDKAAKQIAEALKEDILNAPSKEVICEKPLTFICFSIRRTSRYEGTYSSSYYYIYPSYKNTITLLKEYMPQSLEGINADEIKAIELRVSEFNTDAEYEVSESASKIQTDESGYAYITIEDTEKIKEALPYMVDPNLYTNVYNSNERKGNIDGITVYMKPILNDNTNLIWYEIDENNAPMWIKELSQKE